MRWHRYIVVLFLCCEAFVSSAQRNISDLRILLQDQFKPVGQAVFSLTDASEWKFSEHGKNNWKKATVPGCVHTDINDPSELYYGNNEKKFRWIEEKDWTYITSFRTGSELARPEYISFELVFEQLDVFARVYLNDQLVMTTDNAFRPWRTDITGVLKRDTSLNVLRVEFESPVRRFGNLGTKPPHAGGERVYARKAQFEYGWDFAPRFVTSGIRKPVYIVARTARAASIENIFISEKKSDTLRAEMEAMLTINASSACEVYVCRTDVLPYVTRKVNLKPGENQVFFSFTIDHPRQWWPRGYGESVIYPLRFTLQDKPPKKRKAKVLAEKTVVHAFCDIDLVREKDPYGESFYFTVNGKPVFVKGVNLVPYDMFHEYWNDTQLGQIYHLNANMVRVWGGGYYPSEEFYLYCLANGIMVWQDFMFACSTYPQAVFNPAREEVIYQVTRLRHFRNIALWCGNNEINEGWHNWGWQKEFQYSALDSVMIWKQYTDLFEKEIPGIVQQLDSTREYISTSPRHGWGRKESLTEGDCHYWGVWWGKQPIDTFDYRIPRFMSEYGMQSMPPARYLLKYAPLTSGNMDRAALANHQKHPSDFGNLDFYLEKYYKVPENIFDYVYASQLLQAQALKTAIEAHRRYREKCMGTLLWQMNDSWPAISWSLTDHALQPKIAYEQVRSCFENLLLSVEEKPNSFEVYIVSDSIQAVNDTVSFTLYDHKGKVLRSWSESVLVEPGSSKVYLSVPKHETAAYYLNSIHAVIRLQRCKKETVHSFVQPNRLLLEDPMLKAEIVPVNNPCAENCLYEFRLTAEKYCPGLVYYPSDERHSLLYVPYISPAKPLVIRFYQDEYAYYRNLTVKPSEKFMYLYKLMQGK